MFDNTNNTTITNDISFSKDETMDQRRFLYQKAIEAYQFHVNRYHTWMNYYSIFTGALFVGFCSLTTATTKIISGSGSTENYCCYIEDGKILYTLENDYTPLIIAICVLGIVSSMCWFLSLCGHEKWEHNWMKNIEYYEDNSKSNDKNEKIAENDKSYKSYVLYKVINEEGFNAISTHVITKIFIVFVILGWFVCLGNVISGCCKDFTIELLVNYKTIVFLVLLVIVVCMVVNSAREKTKWPKCLCSNVESKLLRLDENKSKDN